MGRAFKEQILWLTRAWDGWSEAEQVVALYSVTRKLSPVPTRFLQILLTYNFPLEVNNDILATEARANDPAWISHITEADDGGTSDLLQHLPLLRPTNAEAKAHYLTLIPKVLSQALSQGTTQPVTLEKARQLLSYALIHPAISPEERRSLAMWLRVLEEKLNQMGLDSSPDTTLGCEEKDDKRTQPELTTTTNFLSDNDYTKPYWSGSPLGTGAQQNKDEGRWSHLEIPASPNNSAASSRSSESESFTEENFHVSSHPGMRDIGIWLKSLRLHKYYGLLCNYRYEELLALDEETLDSKGVTKGARHKIILSILKLKERVKQMETIEKEIMNGGSIPLALNQLRQICITPMLPSKGQDTKSADGGHLSAIRLPSDALSEDPDIPSQFTRVMGKVCTQILVSSRPSNEAMSVFLHIVDRCSHHESFTSAQVKRLMSWKQQVLRIWHPLPPRGKEGRQFRRWSHQFPAGDSFNRSSPRFHQHRYSNPSPSQVAGLLTAAALGSCGGGSPHQTHLIPPPNPFYGIQGTMGQLMTPRNSLTGMPLGASSLVPPQYLLAKRPSLQETPSQLRGHVTLQRTRSAPSRPHQHPQLNPNRSPASPGSGSGSGFLGPKPESYSSWSGGDPAAPNKSSLLSVSPSDQPPGERTPESSEFDLTNRLESLCLSMTEHALG